ncbi:MAG: DUF4313 domain-containing protein [Lachnospiraceae bacterium]|nr:DUF4313 domain-containing protein [Lachnospiraceae bacterium]
MSEKKTLEFDWQFGQEEVSLRVASYMKNNSLYVGLICRTEYGLEPFGDMTVNLPVSDMVPLKSNEAYINGDMSKSLLAFIQKNRLGTVLQEVGYSGYGQYAKVAFAEESRACRIVLRTMARPTSMICAANHGQNMDRLKEFDPAGVERHLQQYSRNNREAKETNRTEDSHKRKRTGR